MALNQINLETFGEDLGLGIGSTITIDGPVEALAISDAPIGSIEGLSAPFLVMSTGLALEVDGENTGGGQGTDLGAGGAAGDNVILSLSVATPRDADNFVFDFTFLSEEFPEFVGSQFNDFFSVLINGVEVALDLQGLPITVNNNFFDGTLSTEGTIFDGRTPLLRATAPIEGGATSLDVQLQIADVGDGIFDSAALIGNFGFSGQQVVFVDFDAAFLSFDSIFSSGLSLPDAGLTNAQENQVLNRVRDIYSAFQVEFVSEEPLSGPFSTVHVGGSIEDLPSFFNASEGLLGLAEKIDSGNNDLSDNAFVLSDEILLGSGAPDLDLIAQVIAHEAGHLFGLRHVADENQLMFPLAIPGATEIGGPSQLAEFVEGQGIVTFPFFQDSFAELANNLGLNEADVISSVGLADQITKFFTFELSSDVVPMRDAVAVIADTDGQVLELLDLGVIRPGEIVNFFAPAIDTDRIAIFGKSEIDGPFDVFLDPGASASTLTAFATLTQDQIIDAFGIEVGALSNGVFPQTLAEENASSQSGQAVTQTLALAEIDASNLSETLTGLAETNNRIIALGGDDTVTGDSGDDDLFGNEGDDSLLGGDGDDFVDGGAGDDEIFGGAESDFLVGGDGDDTLTGDSGADVIEGGDGDDEIVAGLGDFIDGGAGDDLARLSFTFASAEIEAGAEGAVFVVGDQQVEVVNVEELEFIDRVVDDEFIARFLLPNIPSVGDDFLRGADGGDVLIGMAGDDTISGFRGADRLEGGRGRDSLDGGGGADTLIGGGGRDTLLGGFGRDELDGGGGRDRINGGSGRDDILGGGGADAIRGGGGGDDINGGGGADVINGGRGQDDLTGGGGRDVFQFRTGDGADTIADFQQGRDKIEALNSVEAFSDIAISQAGNNVLISFANVRITVLNQDEAAFTAGDFIF